VSSLSFYIRKDIEKDCNSFKIFWCLKIISWILKGLLKNLSLLKIFSVPLNVLLLILYIVSNSKIPNRLINYFVNNSFYELYSSFNLVKLISDVFSDISKVF